MSTAKLEEPKRTRNDPRRDATRKRLIRACLEIIRDEGSAGVSKAEVCRRAGIHRSGFYSYFETVDALLGAAGRALTHYTVERDTRVRRALTQPIMDLPRTLTTVRTVLNDYMEDPAWARFMVTTRQEPSLLGRTIREGVEAATNAVRDDLWITAVELGLGRECDKELRRLARFIVDTILSTIARLLEAPVSEQEAIVDATGTHIYFAAIGTFSLLRGAAPS